MKYSIYLSRSYPDLRGIFLKVQREIQVSRIIFY